MKRVFWDIETSPNTGFFWRPGPKVSLDHNNIIEERAIVCICWKWEGKKRVHSLEWDSFSPNIGSDKEMLKVFVRDVLQVADESVAHNGDRFDLPWVKGRCMKHGIDINPFQKTIDTCVWARKMGLNSARLDYLGKFLFNKGKLHTDYDMWRDIVLDGCQKSMKRMVRYCKEDVRLLERVYEKLAPFNKVKTHVGVQSGNGKASCSHCGHEEWKVHQTKYTAAGTCQKVIRCKKCGRYSTISESVYKKARGL